MNIQPYIRRNLWTDARRVLDCPSAGAMRLERVTLQHARRAGCALAEPDRTFNAHHLLDTSLPRQSRLSLASLLIIIGLAIAPIHTSAASNDPNSGVVSAGNLHACRIKSDGTLGCWGWNAYGQTNSPTGTFISVGAGAAHSCGVRSDGTLACWGNNDYGQASPPTGAFTSVSVGAIHDCGVRSDGTLACWGADINGRASPPPGSFLAVSAGTNHSCGLRSDRTLVCWGNNNWGQASPPSGEFTSVSAGEQYTCGVRSDATLACWGQDSIGQASPPVGLFSSVSTHTNHSCGIHTDGTLACWGQDASGAINPPVGAFIALTVGITYSCGVRLDETLACWGYDYYGEAPQLGLHPATLPFGTASAAYSQALGLVDMGVSASNDFPYMPPTPGFALTAGALPPGLTLTAAGVLSGTPTRGGNFSFTVEGEDGNGFIAQRSYTLAIDGPTDDTPPVITPTVSGTLGNNGWYTSDVAISWSVSDAESDITSTIGCNAVAMTTDAGGAGFTCTATSGGGTSSQSVTVKRDATAPVLTPQVTPIVVLLRGSASIVANASDALSGIATQVCAALDAATVGNHSSACTATDLAGNSATATATYSVIYGFVGFSAPVDNPPTVNLANAGQTVPFKWRLVDANGAPVINLAGVTVQVISTSCDGSTALDEVELYTSASAGFHNLGNGNYQYNWQSPKSYQSTCKKVVLNLGDGSTRVALFHFH